MRRAADLMKEYSPSKVKWKLQRKVSKKTWQFSSCSSKPKSKEFSRSLKIPLRKMKNMKTYWKTPIKRILKYSFIKVSSKTVLSLRSSWVLKSKSWVRINRNCSLRILKLRLSKIQGRLKLGRYRIWVLI